jgi:hypothetical protein
MRSDRFQWWETSSFADSSNGPTDGTVGSLNDLFGLVKDGRTRRMASLVGGFTAQFSYSVAAVLETW